MLNGEKRIERPLRWGIMSRRRKNRQCRLQTQTGSTERQYGIRAGGRSL